jgi:ketosteroid isomerase-like protein
MASHNRSWCGEAEVTAIHRNEALARREIDLINTGDYGALEDLYTDDCTIHYPGRNPLAGTHSVEEFVAKFQALMEDGILTRELHDALGTDDHAVQLLHVNASARGRSHSWNAVAVLHVRDGRFSECWIHVDDQYALDGFLNSLVE